MAVANTEIKIYLSGGGSNTDPNLSLGGAISTTEWGSNIFDNVDSTEASTGDNEYRCVYVKNTNATDTLYDAIVWISVNTPSSYSEVQIALADEGVGATAETVVNESTAPTGPSFSEAASSTTALSLGDLAPGAYYGVWIRRTITANAPAFANDTFTLTVRGNTSA